MPPPIRRSVAAFIVLALVATAGILYLRRDVTDEFRDAYARIDSSEVVDTATVDGSPVEWLHLFDANEESAERVGRVIVRHPATETPPVERRTLVVYAGQQTGDALLEIIPQRPGLTLVAPLYPEIDDDGLLDQVAFPGRLRRAVYSTVASGMAGLDRVGENRGRRIVLAASLGTAFGTLHAALDERVDELVIVHGGGEFPAVMRHLHRNRDQPVRAALFPWIAEVLIDSYDPVRWIGAVSPRPVLVIASRHDRHFPPESIRAVYDAAGEPKELRWTGSEHVGEGKTEIVDAILAQVEAWMDRPGG